MTGNEIRKTANILPGDKRRCSTPLQRPFTIEADGSVVSVAARPFHGVGG